MYDVYITFVISDIYVYAKNKSIWFVSSYYKKHELFIVIMP